MIAGCTAYDLIVVSRKENTDGEVQGITESTSNDPTSGPSSKNIACSECMFRFGSKYSSSMSVEARSRIQQHYAVYLIVVHPTTGDTMRFPISVSNTLQPEQSEVVTGTSTPQHDETALMRIIEQLSEGISNKAHYILVSKLDDEIIGIAPFDIYVWHSDCKVAVIDVDGTITTSTLTGFWNTAVMHDYSSKHCHDGVCRFLSKLVETASSIKLRLLYLTNRPITYVDATRNLLIKLHEDSYPLPRGPLIGFMGELAGVFKMDFYHINAHEFKYDTIQKYVTQPFLSVGVKRNQLFYAGFGNTVYDMHAYHNAGIDLHRMFLIDKKSRIFCLDSTSFTSGDSKSIQRALDHPRRYATVKGTLFADGYDDPKLITYLLNVNLQQKLVFVTR